MRLESFLWRSGCVAPDEAACRCLGTVLRVVVHQGVAHGSEHSRRARGGEQRQKTPPTGQPDHGRENPFNRHIPSGVGYLGVALLVAWLLQSVIGPLLSPGVEIPYSEFKAQLAAGQLVDVTVGPTIDGQ